MRFTPSFKTTLRDACARRVCLPHDTRVITRVMLREREGGEGQAITRREFHSAFTRQHFTSTLLFAENAAFIAERGRENGFRQIYGVRLNSDRSTKILHRNSNSNQRR